MREKIISVEKQRIVIPEHGNRSRYKWCDSEMKVV